MALGVTGNLDQRGIAGTAGFALVATSTAQADCSGGVRSSRAWRSWIGDLRDGG
jgi:hypothetical protein